MNTYSVEFTDTFGGEANYCWIRRYEVKARSLRGAIVAGKRKAGFTGRHTRSDMGEGCRIDFVGACIVGFIDFKE